MNIKSQKGSVEVLSFLKTFIFFLIAFFLIRGTIVQAFKIPSGSMKPTLQIHDRILVNKLSYGLRVMFFPKMFAQWSEIKKGDIVVFTRPDEPETRMKEHKTNFIKRVIAVEGDVVEVRGTKVFVNGEYYENDKDYARYVSGGLKNFPPTEVPKGRIFLLGDNRDESRDSRFWKPSPFLDRNLVKGRAFVVFWNHTDIAGRFFKLLK